jgi:hypothetical protein
MSLSLFFSNSGYETRKMIRQNEKLDHKNPKNYRKKVIFLKFNSNDQGNREKDIP